MEVPENIMKLVREAKGQYVPPENNLLLLLELAKLGVNFNPLDQTWLQAIDAEEGRIFYEAFGAVYRLFRKKGEENATKNIIKMYKSVIAASKWVNHETYDAALDISMDLGMLEFTDIIERLIIAKLYRSIPLMEETCKKQEG